METTQSLQLSGLADTSCPDRAVRSGVKTPRQLAAAISYLRVSTKEQAERGGREEGFSIPAQREANQRKADSLGAEIVAEFVDAGESARRADRPELQRMLAYVARHRVQYCIVHKLDRLARNRADDVAIHFALQQAGVTLVSTTENIDESPSGMLMHGIMSSIAEFYSRNLANEVTKGLVQKASLGGTVSRAPLGYRNVIRTDSLGRTDRTVEVDEERSHLIVYAFIRYAEGDTSISQVLEELSARGLTTRPSPRYPAHVLSISALHKILRNPYYKGEIVYRGVRYAGAHQPLIDRGTWEKVQDLLAANHLAGNRSVRRDHYLKGTVYCGKCRRRLLLTYATNRWGTTYPYFVCPPPSQQQRERCTRGALPVGIVEKLVQDHYLSVAISEEERKCIHLQITLEWDELHQANSREREQLERQVELLKRQRTKLLQAHYADAVPLDVLKVEQDRITSSLHDAQRRLAALENNYAAARRHLAQTLELLRDCAHLYRVADDRPGA